MKLNGMRPTSTKLLIASVFDLFIRRQQLNLVVFNSRESGREKVVRKQI